MATPAAAHLPARIRRLTNDEYAATVRSVLAVEVDTEGWVPDARQSGFTRNAEQIVDPLFVRQLQEAADSAAESFVSTQLASAAPCAESSADQACARTLFESLLPRAYRRPLEANELETILAVYDVGATDEGFAGGVRLALSAALQSAAFVYHTELGVAASPEDQTRLTASEAAATLSYLLTGAPADATLLAAADAGALDSAEGRAEQVQRLLATPEARPQLARLIEEWLGIDGVVDKGKDKEQFPDYETLRPHMLAETNAFITDVAFERGGSLATLFSADFTWVDSEMAAFYDLGGVEGTTLARVSLADTPRRGILNHASFLARYATEVDSAPVHRGVAVALRVMCIDPGDPTGLAVDIVPPQPQPGQTTRERFAQHTVDPECAGCHLGIDGIGFTFESFDAIGQGRTEENGKPIDTATELPAAWAAGLDRNTFADSTELGAALAASESVKRCFARHLARFAGATTDGASEDYFLSTWADLEASRRDSILGVLTAYVASDLFVERAAQRGAL